MPNSLQRSAIASPASRRATNCSLSSITEHSFQGITPSQKTGGSVTHVSGTMCYLCLRPLIAESWLTRRCLHCSGNCSGCVVENPHGRPSVYIRGLQPQTGVLGTSYDTRSEEHTSELQ